MVMTAIGIRMAHLVPDPAGCPGSRSLRLIPENGGEIQINVTVSEVRRLLTVLTEAEESEGRPLVREEPK